MATPQMDYNMSMHIDACRKASEDYSGSDPTMKVVSASKALDYMDGNQYHWLVQLLNSTQGIANWKLRKVIPIVENFTKKIIERSALSYQDAPERCIFVGDTENAEACKKYKQYLDDCDAEEIICGLDQVTRLLKCGMLLIVWDKDEKRFFISILHRGNSDIDYDRRTGKIKSVMYTTDRKSVNGYTVFCYIDNFITCDMEDRPNGPVVMPGTTLKNPLGFVPIAHMYDNEIPRTGFFPSSEQWQDLILFNEAFNLINTSYTWAARWQGTGLLFTNFKLADGTIVGPDTVLCPDDNNGLSVGDQLTAEFKTPEVNIKEFSEYLNENGKRIGDSWGVNLKVGMNDNLRGNPDSGFKLIVEEIWNLELRKKRIKSAKTFEKRLYRVISRISDVYGLGLPSDGICYAEFKAPSLPVDETSAWTIAQQKMAVGVLSKVDYLKSQDAELTDDDARAKLAEIAAEKTAAMQSITNSNPLINNQMKDKMNTAMMGGNNSQSM
jgi:hypothetical protein